MSIATPPNQLQKLQGSINPTHSHFTPYWPSLVNRLPNDIDDPSQGLGPHRDLDRGPSVHAHLASDETLSTIHSNGTHCILTWKMKNTFLKQLKWLYTKFNENLMVLVHKSLQHLSAKC